MTEHRPVTLAADVIEGPTSTEAVIEGVALAADVIEGCDLSGDVAAD